jgi:hypothetical protein
LLISTLCFFVDVESISGIKIELLKSNKLKQKGWWFMKRQRKLKMTMVIFLAVFAFIMGGCDIHIVDNGGGFYDGPIYVSEIMVTGDYDLTRLEVEVHIVDANTGRLLGCAGDHQGLRHVNYPDVMYEVYAEFHTPNGNTLYYSDLKYRDIEIWVIEDDLDPCPAPFLPNVDDVIGISGVIDGRELRRQIRLSFDDVVHLRIGS